MNVNRQKVILAHNCTAWAASVIAEYNSKLMGDIKIEPNYRHVINLVLLDIHKTIMERCALFDNLTTITDDELAQYMLELKCFSESMGEEL